MSSNWNVQRALHTSNRHGHPIITPCETIAPSKTKTAGTYCSRATGRVHVDVTMGVDRRCADVRSSPIELYAGWVASRRIGDGRHSRMTAVERHSQMMETVSALPTLADSGGAASVCTQCTSSSGCRKQHTKQKSVQVRRSKSQFNESPTRTSTHIAGYASLHSLKAPYGCGGRASPRLSGPPDLPLQPSPEKRARQKVPDVPCPQKGERPDDSDRSGAGSWQVRGPSCVGQCRQHAGTLSKWGRPSASCKRCRPPAHAAADMCGQQQLDQMEGRAL